jgi:hypothetical protein
MPYHLPTHFPFRIYWDILKQTIKEGREIGIKGLFWRLKGQREAWWEKRDKILVGKDQFGNEYYETSGEIEAGRNRWVNIKRGDYGTYDPSSVPDYWVCQFDF